MTATRTRPAPPPPAVGPPEAPPPTGDAPSERAVPFTLASEGTLALLTVVTVASFGRLFADGSYFLPVLVTALGAHAVAAGCRRFRLPAPVTVGVSIAAAVALVGWVVVPESTVGGVPWLGTLDAIRDLLRASMDDFRQVVAPAPVSDGFLVATMLGTAVAAYLADWAAFRIGATFESALPAFALFVFCAYLGTDEHATTSLAAFSVALLLHVAVHHARMQSRVSTWFASTSASAAPAILRGTGAIGGVALLAALFIGPNLPGANDKAVLDRDGRSGGGGSRTTISPLVDIRGRLVDNSDIEVFTVESDHRTYWRLTSLSNFDGDIWSSNESYRPARGRLPQVQAENGTDVVATQRFDISSLASIWLPAAYEPERVSGVNGVSYSVDSGSLISPLTTTDGLAYTVQSRIPRPTASTLGAIGATVSPGPQYLALPPIADRVRAQALRTAGAGTPYQRALALQQFFRGGLFRYDLRVTQGHGSDALSRFLFETRRGYCEQFAGAFAVMARAVGLPARVAVGFTPGELGDDGRYHVRALNAHAWPEVFIAGVGWVAFEPTPGRGMPGAEEYTGVPEAQANEADPTSATTTPPTTAGPEPAPGESPTTTPAPPDQVASEGGLPEPPGFLTSLARPLVAVVLAMAVYSVGVPGLRRRRRARRHRAARTADDQVMVAWADAGDSLAWAGLGRRRAETPAEYAARVGRSGSLPPQPTRHLEALASEVVTTSYAPDGATPEAAGRARQAADSLAVAVRARASGWERVRRALDPRDLLRD